MAINPTYATVENEDCTLHYWYLGTGPLIVLVPNGWGHGSQYNNIMPFLATKYTVATFDRRQMSASKAKVNKTISHPQQARDIAAVIRALGYSKAILFGSSLGGVITFQFGIDHPQMVDVLIAHEAPTTVLMPEASKGVDGALALRELYLSAGAETAREVFERNFQSLGEDEIPAHSSPSPENVVNFFENEFLLGAMYCPDLRKLVKNKISTGVLAGKRSGNSISAEATLYQAELLGCERMVVPGNHFGFEVEAVEFAPAMMEMVDLLQKKKYVV